MGVSPLQLSRGWLTSASSSNDGIDQGRNQIAVIEPQPGDSIFAVELRWPSDRIHPRLTDPWWRRLDSFAVDYFDPRVQDLLEQRYEECRHADKLRLDAALSDAACDGGNIVEVILSANREPARVCLSERSNNLLVDMIHLERTRW